MNEWLKRKRGEERYSIESKHERKKKKADR